MLLSLNGEEKLGIDKKEVIRYLGYGKALPDNEILKLIENIVAETENAVSPVASYEKYPLTFFENGRVDIGPLSVTSNSLFCNLSGCKEAFVFVSTVGHKVDRLIKEKSIMSTVNGAIAQATGAAAAEAFADYVNLKLNEDLNGCYLRPRFSPGYGDFDVAYQPQILMLADKKSKTGIYLTESLMMIPSKSVSAVVGICRDKPECEKSGCADCGSNDCPYRR